jgi:hypothetical protein
MSYLSSGAEQAVINAYSSSIVTPYNWTSASFVYRDFYYQYASAAQDISSGVLLNQVLPNAINPAVRFVLLGGEDAGYTGMAARFKSILMDDGILTPIGDGKTAGDLHASILVADNRKALIGRNVVMMTEAGQALDMIQRLRELASGGIRVELDGYQKGGLTTQPPKLGRLMGGDGAWKTVFESFDSLNARLYLKRDYYRVYGGATGYSRSEIALNSSEQLAGMHNEKNISRGSISSKEYMYYRFLHPEAVGRLLESDQKRLDDLGVDGLSFDTVGQILNSVYGDNALSRTEVAAAYRSQLLSTDRDIALHDPSLYLWLCSQVFFDMPTDQTGYMIASHPVPFFPLVLSGCAELYASYANFQADMEGYLLRVLEYGLRPSYLLTWEDAWRLMRTDSRWIYSSQWDVWKTRIEEHMAFLEEGFNAVRGAEFVGHHSLGKELFVSIYSNGAAVYVNYGDRAAEADGIIIPPRGYAVRKEGGGR